MADFGLQKRGKELSPHFQIFLFLLNVITVAVISTPVTTLLVMAYLGIIKLKMWGDFGH